MKVFFKKTLRIILAVCAAAVLTLQAVSCGTVQDGAPPAEAPYTPGPDSSALTAAVISEFSKSGGVISTEVTGALEHLRVLDARKAARWDGFLHYWASINSEGTPDVLLPSFDGDTSDLCIVVLGFQLMPDGSMKNELVGRCEKALQCAELYPDAYIAVTGGGTASGNREATEAGCMAQWLIEKGISADRIIVEDKSMTTSENAIFTGQIIREKYPAIKNLIIVTSDYHILRGCAVFATDAYLSGSGINITGTAAWKSGQNTGGTLQAQVSEVRGVVTRCYA